MTVGDLSEAALIEDVRQRLAPPPPWLIVGIGDDAAVVEPDRNRLEVLTVDALVEGVHFDRRFTPPDAIGHRALAVSLSDLAAMGAAPRLALLSFALPPALPLNDFHGIMDGLTKLAAAHRVTVAGGNLTRTPGPLTLDVTVIGSVKRRHVLTRAGARPGDDVYVSGTVGSAAAGLEVLRERSTSSHNTSGGVEDATPKPDDCGPPTRDRGGETGDLGLVAAYLYPQPRVRLGTLLGRNRAATACIDLSDGLADGVRRLAEAGGVGVEIDAELLPIDAAARGWFARHGADPVMSAVAGGDDYELLFTVRRRHAGRLTAARRHGAAGFVAIGVCTAERDVVLKQGDRRMELPLGYEHFRSAAPPYLSSAEASRSVDVSRCTSPREAGRSDQSAEGSRTR